MKRFINTEELAEYLGVGINTVRSWTFMKKIPYVKMGRLVRFDLKEIDKWIHDNKIEIAEWHRK
jgi:excisionase family DNA binding protein